VGFDVLVGNLDEEAVGAVVERFAVPVVVLRLEDVGDVRGLSAFHGEEYMRPFNGGRRRRSVAVFGFDSESAKRLPRESGAAPDEDSARPDSIEG
jgi:hypothetical protein